MRIYGDLGSNYAQMRALGVVAFRNGLYEFRDGTFALDWTKRYPVPAPSPLSVAASRARLDALKKGVR